MQHPLSVIHVACVAGVQSGGRGEVECEREARSLGSRIAALNSLLRLLTVQLAFSDLAAAGSIWNNFPFCR